jgi:protein involved in polysaccharide export with SLBB domain
MKSRRVFLWAAAATIVCLVRAADSQPSAEVITVVVTGAVNKPGKCRLKIGSIVSDAIASAGGLTRTGRLEIIILSRVGANRERSTHRLNLKDRSASDDMVLRDGDYVYAPEPFI